MSNPVTLFTAPAGDTSFEDASASSNSAAAATPLPSEDEDISFYENDIVVLLRSAFWYPRFYYTPFQIIQQQNLATPTLIQQQRQQQQQQYNNFTLEDAPILPSTTAIYNAISPIARHYLIVPWCFHVLFFFGMQFVGAVLIPHILFGPWRQRNPTIDHIVVPIVVLVLALGYIGLEWWVNLRNRQIDEQIHATCREVSAWPIMSTWKVTFGFLEPFLNRKWHAKYISDISTRVLVFRNTGNASSSSANTSSRRGRLLPRPTGQISFWIKMVEPIGTLVGCIAGFGAGLVLLNNAGSLR